MAASPEAKYTTEKVLWVKRHTPKLMSFAITRPEGYRFTAGQFSRLGFPAGEGFLWRAYSVISAEYADYLEYYAVLIENGPMSGKLAILKESDEILLDKQSTGFLLPERFVGGKDLVMLATGSGIAPFLSMLEQPELWQRFEHVTLVHSVSFARELVFKERLENLKDHPLVGEYYAKFSFVPVTTREANIGMLSNQRIPALLKEGVVEQYIGLPFNREDTRFMVCGNPSMVKDTFQVLMDLGYTMHRNREPGQIMMENGF